MDYPHDAGVWTVLLVRHGMRQNAKRLAKWSGRREANSIHPAWARLALLEYHGDGGACRFRRHRAVIRFWKGPSLIAWGPISRDQLFIGPVHREIG